MPEEEYNGWTNRETWDTALHLSSDQDLYNMINGMVADAHALAKTEKIPAYWSERDFIKFTFEDELKEHIGDRLSTGYWYDMNMKMPEVWRLMQEDVGSLWRIDWQEVAKSFLED